MPPEAAPREITHLLGPYPSGPAAIDAARRCNDELQRSRRSLRPVRFEAYLETGGYDAGSWFLALIATESLDLQDQAEWAEIGRGPVRRRTIASARA